MPPHPMSKASPKQQGGFTLIELLVVAFIISLTAGMLLVNISFGSAQDKIKKEAIRLQSLLRFAHEQSIIRAEEYGIRFHQTGYRFMILENETWIDLSTDRHLTSAELKDNMELELFIEDTEVTINNADEEARLIEESQSKIVDEVTNSDIKPIKPQVFLLSSGELSPEFSSRLRIPGEDIYFDVQGSLNGQFNVTNSNE